ncbi:MAG: L,D-transpeptidase family protein [Hyphomicrobiales bacterium]
MIGRNGRTSRKREGDGCTPIGMWKLGELYYRADRLSRPKSGLFTRPSRRDEAWCDDVSDRRYNLKIRVAHEGASEGFWRRDCAYDIMAPTSHNTRPRVRGLGSAIFFHLWGERNTGTAGCVALRLADMRKILPRLSRHTVLVIWPAGNGPPGALQKSPSRP